MYEITEASEREKQNKEMEKSGRKYWLKEE